jgi:hypothetical protein
VIFLLKKGKFEATRNPLILIKPQLKLLIPTLELQHGLLVIINELKIWVFLLKKQKLLKNKINYKKDLFSLNKRNEKKKNKRIEKK